MTASSAHAAADRPLPLRKRPDLDAQRLQFGGRAYWAIKDPVSLRYYQLREEEYFLLRALDGRNSLHDLQQQFEKQFAPQRLSRHQLLAFLGMLHDEGLIVADAPGQADELLVRYRRQRWRSLLESASNILAIRFRGIDPEPILTWLAPRCRWLFSAWFLAGCCLLVLAALTLVTVQFDRLQSKLPEFHTFFRLTNAHYFLLALAISKILHEFGHALTCKHFGGECHEMGVMLLVFTPCLYCNVSDAWMWPNKRHRMAVGAAGICVEVVLAALCTFLWWFSQPGLFNSLCLHIMFVCSVSTVLFNGNPLLRYDGYYVLADLLEVPNLRQQAGAIVRGALARWFLGTEPVNDRMLPERHRGRLAAFAIASTCYRWFVVMAILWFVLHVLKPYDLEVLAQGLALTVVGGLIVGPATQGVRFLQDPSRTREVQWPRLIGRGGFAAAVLVVILAVPLPFRITVPVVVEPQDAHRVYVTVPGTLTESVRVDDEVTEGQMLARLENLELRRQVVQLEGQRDQQQLVVSNLERRQTQDSSAESQLPTAREALADLEERLKQRLHDQERLELTAPVAGTILPPPRRREPPGSSRRSTDGDELPQWSGTPLEPENLGSFLEMGTLFCLVGDPQRLEAALVIDQADIDFVNTGQSVRIRLDQLPAAVLDGTITEIAAIDLDVAPPELIAHADLPVKTDKAGRPRPLSTSYQARVALQPHDRRLLLGATGEAKISVAPQSLGARLLRFLKHTFQFEL